MNPIFLEQGSILTEVNKTMTCQIHFVVYHHDIRFTAQLPLGILGSDGSRIPLMSVLGGVIIVALSISSENRLNINRVQIT